MGSQFYEDATGKDEQRTGALAPSEGAWLPPSHQMRQTPGRDDFIRKK